MSTDEANNLMRLDSLHYDSGLVSAVKIFQQRHGLEQDGIISRSTLTYLNQSFKEKADLIERKKNIRHCACVCTSLASRIPKISR